MPLPLAIAIYFICWWLVLFIVLPIGLRTQEEEGRVEPGTVPSAPIAPYIARKLIATTILSGLVFAGVYTIWDAGLESLDSIPFLPRFLPQSPAQ